MERRLVIFLILSFGILLGYSWLMQWLYPPRRRPLPQENQVAVAKPPTRRNRRPAVKKNVRRRRPRNRPPEKPAAKPEKAPPAIKAAPEPEAPEQWVTLGSAERRRSVPHAGHVDQPGGGRGADRVEQPALLRHRRPQRLPGPPGDGLGGCAARAVRCRSSAPARPPPRPDLKPGDVIKAVDGKAGLRPGIARSRLGRRRSPSRPCNSPSSARARS